MKNKNKGDKAELMENVLTAEDLEILIRKEYLKLQSIRKVSKKLNIKTWKVRKILQKLELNLSKNDPRNKKEMGFEELNIDKIEFAEMYEKLGSAKKLSEFFKIGQNKTRKLLKELGVLKPIGCKLKEDKKGKKNPFSGKTHTEETKKHLSRAASLRTKERNPNYKNGKYIRRPRDFKIGEFQPIKNDVFTRDNYTCCICGKKGGHLHAHHLIPYWVKPEAFLDKDNLVTVCTECHFNKAHNGNWQHFNIEIISDELILKYQLDRERLNVLATWKKTK
jgi:hypothetical protein